MLTEVARWRCAPGDAPIEPHLADSGPANVTKLANKRQVLTGFLRRPGGGETFWLRPSGPAVLGWAREGAARRRGTPISAFSAVVGCGVGIGRGALRPVVDAGAARWQGQSAADSGAGRAGGCRAEGQFEAQRGRLNLVAGRSAGRVQRGVAWRGRVWGDGWAGPARVRCEGRRRSGWARRTRRGSGDGRRAPPAREHALHQRSARPAKPGQRARTWARAAGRAPRPYHGALFTLFLLADRAGGCRASACSYSENTCGTGWAR